MSRYMTWEEVPTSDVTFEMTKLVTPDDGSYIVRSRTSASEYRVTSTREGIICSCPSGRTRWKTKEGKSIGLGCCWHARAAAFVYLSDVSPHSAIIDPHTVYKKVVGVSFDLE